MAPQPRGAPTDARVAVTCLSPVPAGAPFPCVVSVLGAGEAPPPLLVQVELPAGVLHLGHDSSGEFNADARKVTFRSPGTADAPRTFRVDLIADEAAAGSVAPVTVTMRAFGLGEPYERLAAASVAVERRSSVDLGVAVVPMRPLTLFTLMALSVPVCLGIVWLLRRKRRALAFAPRRQGYRPVPRDTVMVPVFFCIVCTLALLAAAPAVVESLRSHTTFVEARCTVLDRARSGSPYGDGGDLAPMAALRYRTPAGPRVSLGFDARGAFNGADTAAYQDFTVGRDYPCWFDPQRPGRVVLRRGPTGVALLAMMPAVALLGLASGVRRAWRA